MNKYFEILKKLVQKHPALIDTRAELDTKAAGHDLRMALIDSSLTELRECVPLMRKRAVVKWLAQTPHASPRGAIEVEGRLILFYGSAKQPPTLTEGQQLDVTLRPDPYGSYDVAEWHADAPAEVSP